MCMRVCVIWWYKMRYFAMEHGYRLSLFHPFIYSRVPMCHRHLYHHCRSLLQTKLNGKRAKQTAFIKKKLKKKEAARDSPLSKWNDIIYTHFFPNLILFSSFFSTSFLFSLFIFYLLLNEQERRAIERIQNNRDWNGSLLFAIPELYV